MKKAALVIIAISLSLHLNAQDNPKQKEVGLAMSNFNYFGLTYRFGTSKSLWRLNTLLLSGNKQSDVSDSLDQTWSTSGFGIAVGKEFRTSITNNLEFRYGVDITFDYSSTKRLIDDKTINDRDQKNSTTLYTPGVNLVFGLNYVFNDNFVIGAELLPGIAYSTGTRKYYNWARDENDIFDVSGFSYGISNTSARLTLLYRF